MQADDHTNDLRTVAQSVDPTVIETVYDRLNEAWSDVVAAIAERKLEE